MAENKPTLTPAPIDAETLRAATVTFGPDAAAILGDAIATALSKANPKALTIGQYIKTDHSAFNHKKLKFRPNVTFFQNGTPLLEWNLTSGEIDYLNRLTHSGRYFDRKVEVLYNDEGSETVVTIRFQTKDKDKNYELKGQCRNFEDMLRQIVEIQEAEDKDAAEAELERATAPKARHFGDGAASREARARAAQ